MVNRWWNRFSQIDKVFVIIIAGSLIAICLTLLTRSRPLTDGQRLKLGHKWLVNVDAVAKESGDKEALSIAAFIKRTAIICKPTKIGGQMLEGDAPKGEWLAVFPIEPRDFHKGPIWTVVSHPAFLGLYLPNMTSLAFKTEPEFGPKMQGIIGLHEGHHAVGHSRMRELDKYPSDPLEPEVGAYDLMRRILRALGGDTYHQAVLEETEHVATTMLAGGPVDPGKQSRVQIGLARHHPEFSQFLGKSRSEREEVNREQLLLLDVIFSICEREPNQQKQKAMKLRFIRDMTQEADVPREWVDPLPR